jgi:hypothetical protein
VGKQNQDESKAFGWFAFGIAQTKVTADNS